MRSNKSLTISDLNYISCAAKTIAKLEKSGVSEAQIKRQLYLLGTYVFRQYHKAGLPADLNHPLLSAPIKVWSKEDGKYVPEKELVAA